MAKTSRPPFRHTPESEKFHAHLTEKQVVRKKTKKKMTIYSIREKGVQVAMERRRASRGKTTSCSR